MDAGNLATWAGVVVAISVALLSYRQTKNQAKISKETAEASHRQAEATERRAITVEDSFEQLLRSLAAGITPAAPPPPPAPVVSWELERRGKHMFLLRNTGTVTATGVRVAPEELTSIVSNIPENASVRPRESVEFLMAASLATPLPGEIWLTWDGQDEPVAVPVPHP